MRGNRRGKLARHRLNVGLATKPPATKTAQTKPAESGSKTKRRALFGLLKRKEKWTLSWRGRFVVLAALIIFAWFFVHWIHPFLAITDRVDSQYLVVEGWLPNYALEESIAEFRSSPHQMIFTVGADPLNAIDLENQDSLATVAAKRLNWMGVEPELVTAVPAHIKYRNRTFESAVALRKWIEENHLPVTSFNVVSLGAHARRSRLLFQEAFGTGTRVGIISVEHREYDPKHWWKYSEGVREVIGEGVAYFYARFLFHPNQSELNP